MKERDKKKESHFFNLQYEHGLIQQYRVDGLPGFRKRDFSLFS